MAKSIIQPRASCQCYICLHLEGDASTKSGLEEHHVLHGAYKNLAEQEGLKVMLCKRHHTGDIDGAEFAVHHNPEIDDWLKKTAQLIWMNRWCEEDGCGYEDAKGKWYTVFGKSWV